MGRHNLIRRITMVAVLMVSALSSIGIKTTAAERVRVGLTTKDFGYLPLFVGIRAGYFAGEGIDLQWIQVRSNVATSALIGGELDVAASAGTAMRTATRGAPL